MNEVAANLVDRVLASDVPYRQWVLSLPFGLRRLLANNGDLCTAVLGVFIRKVFAWLKRKARRLGVKDPSPGAVLAIQRANAALQSCLHFPAVVTDGVFHPAGEAGCVAFCVVDPPTDRELARLVRLIARRIGRTLERLGYTADTLPDDGNDHAWMVAVAASDQGTLRLRIEGLDEPFAEPPRFCAFAG